MIASGLLIGVATVWFPWSVAQHRCGSVSVLELAAVAVCRSVGQSRWCGVLTASTSLLHRVSGSSLNSRADEESIEEEIRTIVSEGHREGLLEEEAREMIEGVIELGDAAVSHIMTPRTEIHMVQINTPGKKWSKASSNRVTHALPVYDKNSRRHRRHFVQQGPVAGTGEVRPSRVRTLAELLRKPLFVPETKPVDDLLKLFQKSRTHIAVVLDEYGGVVGAGDDRRRARGNRRRDRR